jgi:hypothetical protein
MSETAVDTPKKKRGRPKEILSHDDRAARRKRIADRVRKGDEPLDVARDEGVTFDTVRKACETYGLKVNREAPVAHTSYRVLALLLNTNRSFSSIARELNLGTPRVTTVANQAKAAGIVLRCNAPQTILVPRARGLKQKVR